MLATALRAHGDAVCEAGVADGCRAMGERRGIKSLLRVG